MESSDSEADAEFKEGESVTVDLTKVEGDLKERLEMEAAQIYRNQLYYIQLMKILKKKLMSEEDLKFHYRLIEYHFSRRMVHGILEFRYLKVFKEIKSMLDLYIDKAAIRTIESKKRKIEESMIDTSITPPLHLLKK